MQILHVDSSLLGDASASRQLTSTIVRKLLAACPVATVKYRDLATNAVPHLTGEVAAGFRSHDAVAEVDAATAQDRALSEELVTEFLASSVIVIGAPMYNFSVASQLKAWIDRVAQPGRTFRYTAEGPVGLSGGRRVIVASTRGGVYSMGAASSMDFQESYLQAIFKFLGISEVQFVRAERLTKGADLRRQSIAGAEAQVVEAVSNALVA